MTDLTELEAKYEALDRARQELGKEIERLKSKPAQTDGPMTEAPEKNQHYWFIDDEIDESEWFDDSIDRGRLVLGNAFATKEAAEREANRRRATHKLRTIAARLNAEKGWVADWSDIKQDKLTLSFNHVENRWQKTTHCLRQYPSAIYFAPGLGDQILAEMGDDMEWLK